MIKTHTIEGYKILQNQPVNDHIKNAALMHHERCDGSGYPFGLTGNRIDKFAKIVSIADVYDAMTAARVYRGPLCPFTVIDIFEKEGLQKYESEYILCFLKNVVLTYIGQRVRLTNGQEGDVVSSIRSSYPALWSSAEIPLSIFPSRRILLSNGCCNFTYIKQ